MSKHDMNQLINDAMKRGWVLVRSKRHIILEWPPTRQRVAMARTPSDSRAAANNRTIMARIESGTYQGRQR